MVRCKKLGKGSLIFLALLLFGIAAQAQEITVSGTIIDSNTKNTLPGVNISVKGTTNGTFTEEDGTFKLIAPSKQDTLVFSFVGYEKREIPIQGRSNLGDVTLTPRVFQGKEMVVTGYGSVQKRDFTGAVSHVSSEDIEHIPATNVKDILGVTTTGTQGVNLTGAPGGRSPIMIRGNTSISSQLNSNTAFSSPLYVIDGVQTSLENLPGYYESNQDFLASLNPDDIKSIDILKDASATAIYGSRGANGVIVIETKGGLALNKPQFSFSSDVGIQPQPELVPMLAGAAERQRKMEMVNRWWTYEDKMSNAVPTVLTDSLNPAFNNDIDYQGLFYRPGMRQNYNLSMRGGSETANYRISTGYSGNKGIVQATGFDRYTLNAHLDSKFTDKFTNNLLAKVFYTDNKTGQGNPYQATYNLNNTLPVDPTNLQSSLFRITDAQKQSFKGQLADKMNEDHSVETTLSDFGRYSFLPWLNLSSQLTFTYNSNKKNYYEPSSIRYQDDGFASYSLNNRINLSEDTYLNFLKQFGEDQNLAVLLGNRINYNKYESLYLSAEGRGSDAIKVINNRYQVDEIGGTSGLGANATVSFYGRIRYKYKERYIFTANFSRDGSSRFGSENRWANFPSAAVGWIFSDEPFIKPLTSGFLDYGKIRFSWGINGKQFSENYIRYGSYSLGYGGNVNPANQLDVSSYGGVTGIIPNYNSIGNKKVSWQRSTQWDLGVDLEMFNRRVNLTFDAYNKMTDKLFFAVNFPAFSGYNSAKANVAGVENYGWEAQVQYHVTPRTNDFHLKLGVALSQNNNYVTKLPNGNRDYIGSNYGYVVGRPITLYKGFINSSIVDDLDDLPVNPYTGEHLHGKPNGAWSYTRAGLPVWVDLNGDNYLDEAHDNRLSQEYSPTPDLTGSFNVSIDYKSWYLRAYSQFSFGADIYNSVLQQYMDAYDRGGANWAINGLADLSKYSFWKQPGDGATARFPALVPVASGIQPFYSFRGNQTLWIESGDYWRISNITLGHTFRNSKFLKNSGLSQLRIYGSVSNPWQWQKSDAIRDASLVDAKGHTLGNGYPRATTVSLGIDITF